MKIMIAFDGSDYTKRMLDYLAAGDEIFGPRHDYTVIHSVHAVPRTAPSYFGTTAVKRHYEAEAGAVLEPVRAFLDVHGIEAEYVDKVGQAAPRIAELAEEGRFDLLVMGSRGHGNRANLLLGSVATKVLALCTIPVLLVR